LYEFDQFAGGNILKYNPVSGSVEVVVDQKATTMIVYPDGIYYNNVGESVIFGEKGEMRSTPADYFYFSFAEKTVTSFPKIGIEMRRWKSNCLVTKLEDAPESNPVVQQMREWGYTDNLTVATGVEVTDVDGTVLLTLKDIIMLPDSYWLSGDVLYYIEQKEVEGSERKRSVLMTYDLETGVTEDVVVLDLFTMFPDNDMLLHNNTLYFGNLLRVSLEDGTQCHAQYADSAFGFYSIDAFYTDGEVIFCLCNNTLWRMEENKAVPISVREMVPGVPLEIGTYEYHLYPLGE
ncbi:MAG: hypothetical protein ACI4QX_04180, partial [Lachnospiraceae bacterium]